MVLIILKKIFQFNITLALFCIQSVNKLIFFLYSINIKDCIIIVMKTNIFIFKNKNVNIFFLILSVLSAFALIILIIKSTSLGMFYVKTSGSPTDSITRFYSAIIASDYDTACTYLADYDELGLDNIPETSEGQLLLDSLKSSYSYSLIGQPTIDKLNAVQRVSFTYLNISTVESETASKMDSILDDKVQTLPRNELFDDNNNYLPELIDAVYEEALTDTLANSESYYETVEYDVFLEYKNNKWVIKTNNDMLTSLLGGIK